VTKPEILRRLRHVITDLKSVTTHSRFLGEETADLDFAIEQIEKELAKLIDDYMASQIANYNRQHNRKYGSR
jgi:hypothetical protein